MRRAAVDAAAEEGTLKTVSLWLGGLLLVLAPRFAPLQGQDRPIAAAQAAPALAPGQPEPVKLTLADALRRALAANPGLGVARLEIAAAQAQKDLAIASVLPHFQATGNLLRNTVESSFDFNGNRVVLLPRNDWNYKLTVTQPIYAGNRERRALSQARLGISTAERQAEGSAEQLLLAVVSDYLGVLQGQELLDVERRNLSLTEERRTLAQNLFEAGETTRVDTLRAEADIKAAQRRVADAQRMRDEAESRLRLDLALESPLAVEEPSALFPRLADEAALVASAEKQRPEVAEAEIALATARLEVDKQRGAYYPVLSAEGDFLSQRSSFPADRYGQLALKLTVPIWQGGETAARVAFARDRQRQAELHLDEVRRTVREEVRRAFVDLASAEASLGLARDQLAASEAEYRQAADLYRAQELTTLDAEAAETSLAEARRAVTTSRLDRQLAELRVWAAAGMLQKTVLQEGAR
jgi:outer membrane protein